MYITHSASSITTVLRTFGPPTLFTVTILPILTTVPITSANKSSNCQINIKMVSNNFVAN